MSVDRSVSELDQIKRIYHSGMVPPPPGSAMQYSQMSPAPAQGECQDLILPGLFLRKSRFCATLNASGRGDSENHIFVFSSRLEYTGILNGRPYYEGLTFVAGTQPFEVLLPPMDFLGLLVSRHLLARYLETVEGMTPPAWLDDGVRFLNGRSVNRAAAMIERLLADHCDNLDALADAERRAALVWSVLEILGPLLLGDDGDAMADYRLASRHQIVRRAREYMLDRIDEPLQISRICRDLGVSRRALQYSFQDVLGINPVAFMRILRLSGARRDLFKADTALQVKDVIDRWGFWHPSRFSCEYKQMFSECPSETIRRRRAETVKLAPGSALAKNG
ncbi:MAG TPA: helix-turn-helix domain-containing protein [Phenylobacterium sp.]|uniref:helix-turn-helix domain-containing protein n=1 Tax=Phenylobacterium sp. TaxID=1871053 RepID=UPI002B49D4D1|nr:helix-turn-helix domain-containing protein [Phenylobacterium sp.]HKR87601.1 helix-turn-helix domain-containing protein [Phenylobacterium sp.]